MAQQHTQSRRQFASHSLPSELPYTPGRAISTCGILTESCQFLRVELHATEEAPRIRHSNPAFDRSSTSPSQSELRSQVHAISAATPAGFPVAWANNPLFPLPGRGDACDNRSMPPLHVVRALVQVRMPGASKAQFFYQSFKPLPPHERHFC